jgi:hypothetical protein
VTLALGICGCAALFVVFGLIGGGHETHEKDSGCGTCSTDDDTAKCGSCHTVRDISEHSHV